MFRHASHSPQSSFGTRYGLATSFAASLLFSAACGESDASPEQLVDDQDLVQAGVVAAPGEVEFLAAYLDPADATLFVASAELLAEGLEQGFWPELEWTPGDPQAFFIDDDGERKPADLKPGAPGDVAAKKPKLGASRYLLRRRTEREYKQRVGDCLALTAVLPSRQATVRAYADSLIVSGGPLPAAALELRNVIVTHKYLTVDDAQGVLKTEQLRAVRRIYAYGDSPCTAAGRLKPDYDVVQLWVTTVGVWPPG